MTDPIRELDALVWKALNPRGEIAIKGAGRPGLVDWRCRIPGATIANSWTNPGRYTTSLDAALALAERMLPDWLWGVTTITTSVGGLRKPLASVVRPDQPEGEEIKTWGYGSTPALALCIAILKAKAQGEGR